MKCNSDYHADICPARRRNGDCVSEYPCRHKVEPPKPKTNAQHIRSMTDEELAELLHETDIRKGATNLDGWIDWLKQPYKEDT
jgi:hypothetical protein